MKPVVAIAMLLAVAGCGDRACKSKTMLLTIDYGAFSGAVDSVELQLSYAGEAPSSSTLPHASGAAHGSVEIDFASGYTAGRVLTVTVNGLANGVLVAGASQSFTLASSCTAETLTLSALSGDGGADMSNELGDGGAGDLAEPPPDLTGLIFPSNVSSAYLNASTTDWTITGQTVINTSGTDAASAFTPAAPAGVIYAVDGIYAVVAVHSLTVAANVSLSASGTRPLIIVAGDTIVVNGLIDGGAHGTTAGPGGAPTMGMGHGGNGEAITTTGAVLASGGGGAGYGIAGAVGGDVGGGGINGTAGMIYGTAMLMPVAGGSAGGNGGNYSCNTAPVGGAGGGYLQLSARTSITVAPFSILGSIPSGGISVGGGGGQGCAGSVAGGAGGGSGGALLLESPSIKCSGLLGATGGGGASATVAGSDGLQISNPTASSIGGAPTGANNNGGGSGANGVTAAASPTAGGAGVAGTNMASPVGAGGGGGGSGRIYVRASGTPMIMQSTPVATTDTTLPSKIP